MAISICKLTVLVVFLSLIPIASAQQNASQAKEFQSKIVEYKPGQVWETGSGPTVTVLKVEELPKFGKVVHVRVDNVPNGSCGAVQLTKSINHLALTDKMMRRSEIYFVKEDSNLPESYFDAYREWEKQKKHKVLEVPIQKAILSASTLPGPMICNFLPGQT